jgi:hypothetical protein
MGWRRPFVALTDLATQILERVYGIAGHHHAEYPDDLLLPLEVCRRPRRSSMRSPRRAGSGCGSTLRDVEWAIERRQPWPLGMLTHRPRYAIVADASA